MDEADSNRSTVVDRGRSGTDDERRLGLLRRIAVVFVAVTLIWLLIVYVNQLSFGSGYDRLGHGVNAVLATALAVPTIVLARRFLDERPLAGLGLPPLRTGWRSLLIGMGCYLIPAGIGLVAVLAGGWVEISLDTSLANLVTVFFSLVVLVFLYEALPEELIFRGYIYRNLNTSFPRWSAVGGQAVLFSLWGIAIGATLTANRLIFFFFVAIVIGMIRAITGDIWACVGFHLAFQTVQQLFGGAWVGDVFVVSSPETLETVVLGLIPIALAVLTLEIIVRKETDWRARNPDTVPVERDRSE